MSYLISADSNSEIPPSWEDELCIHLMKMPYTLNDIEYAYDLGRNTDSKMFYDQMRKGASVITAQRNPHEFIEFWEPKLQAGEDILHVSFSSALSGTFNCAQMAAEELREKYPERKLVLVDTLAISMACGLLVREAGRLRGEGKTIEEAACWLDENKQRANAFFTVDDLEYLRRGGRVSGASAFFGNILEIKPVLYINPEGKLVPVDKVKGRKKALKYLADKVAERMSNPSENLFVISHADCPEDAQYLKTLVLARITPKEILMNPVGPVIGSHAGPGTVAAIFMGENRTP